MKYLILLLSFFFVGCSHFSFNASMCDKINRDPNDPVPQECRNYNEEEAEKATNIKEEILEPADAVEFTK